MTNTRFVSPGHRSMTARGGKVVSGRSNLHLLVQDDDGSDRAVGLQLPPRLRCQHTTAPHPTTETRGFESPRQTSRQHLANYAHVTARSRTTRQRGDRA
eukprot:970735-Rhodomonas_salina.3